MHFCGYLQGAKRSPDPDYVTSTQLRHMCDNVLQLLTNTVEQMENVSYTEIIVFVGYLYVWCYVSQLH